MIVRNFLLMSSKTTDMRDRGYVYPNMSLYAYKCERNVVSAHPMKTYRGSGSIAPVILNLDTKWR
jgi:hypothetical protein